MSKRVTSEPEQDKGAARAWCYTFFLPAGAKPEVNEVLAESSQQDRNATVRYFIVQREICPDTGRAHWQGYAEWTAPCKLTAVFYGIGVRLRDQRLRPLRSGEVHCERRRGRRDQARDYCRKDETRDGAEGSGPFEWGMFPITAADRTLEDQHFYAVLDLYVAGDCYDIMPMTCPVSHFVPCIKL